MKYFNNAMLTIDAVSDLKIVLPKLITILSLLLKYSISLSENPPTGPIYTQIDLLLKNSFFNELNFLAP